MLYWGPNSRAATWIQSVPGQYRHMQLFKVRFCLCSCWTLWSSLQHISADCVPITEALFSCVSIAPPILVASTNTQRVCSSQLLWPIRSCQWYLMIFGPTLTFELYDCQLERRVYEKYLYIIVLMPYYCWILFASFSKVYLSVVHLFTTQVIQDPCYFLLCIAWSRRTSFAFSRNF